MNIKPVLNQFTQLKWACRRGMLELDVLLGNFLVNNYDTLNEVQQQQFVALLKEPDPLLFAWLIGQEMPPKELQSITELIRNDAQKKV